MTSTLKLGIAGLGTVGAATIKVLQKHTDMIAARAGRPVEVVAISARDASKDRGFDAGAMQFVDNPLKLVDIKDIDVVVELIGGADGVAKALVESALAAGKHVVTANKALIAHHGLTLAEIAETQGVHLLFEAAVAGGIPVVKTLKEGLAANEYQQISGILNGTSNYILTEMKHSRLDFDAVLKDAQEKGYAEADPTFDIDGIDAAHKLTIMASIAFGVAPHMAHVATQGISHITLADLDYADELGYEIKLLANAQKSQGGVVQHVCPYLVPTHHPLAGVGGVTNAVHVHADLVGELFLEGPGAGGDATASSVVADIMDIAKTRPSPAFGIAADQLRHQAAARHMPDASYYMRLETNDQVGALADITRVCHGQNISVDMMKQPRHSPGTPAPAILTTHPVSEHAVQAAVAAIGALPSVVSQPQMIRMLS